MKKITVYEKPTCSACRKVVKSLTENGIDFEKVNYYIKPLSKTKLKSLLTKMNMRPSEVLRTKEEIYKKLNLKSKNPGEDSLLDLLVKHPDLLQRPIVEIGDMAILARPAEKINELFK